MATLSVIEAVDIVTHPSITGVIGRGSCGTVRLCKTNTLGQIAVKCLLLAGMREEIERRKDKIKEEANILLKLSHKNIIEVFGVTTWENSFGILTEYLPGGNLDHFLSKLPISVIPWCVKLRIAEELSEAISFLHNGNGNDVYVHGDIKPENILLSEDLTVKLADFGSVNITAHTGATSLTIGFQPTNKQHTPFYTAPEFLRNVSLKRKTTMDIYSFGMVLYEIVTRKRIFQNASLPPSTILQVICDQGQKPDLLPIEEIKSNLNPDDMSMFDVMTEIMTNSWSMLPKDRPNIQKVKTSLYKELRKVDETTMEQQQKQLIEALDFQPSIVDEESSTTLNQFRFPFEEASTAFPTANDINSNNPYPMGTSSQHESTNLSHVHAQEKSTTSSEILDDNTIMADSTLASEEDVNEKTALLGNSNTSSTMMCFTRKRKATVAVFIATLLMIPSAGIFLYFRFTKSSNHSVTYCKQISINGMDDKSYCTSHNKIIPIKEDSTSIGYPNGTTCHIACSSSYILQGAEIVYCNTSSWQPNLPICKIKECPPFNLTAFETTSCTKGRDISSVCSFTCIERRQLVGNSSITCQPSLKWSDVPPTCNSCAQCLTGPECKDSTSWAKLIVYVQQIAIWGTTEAQYAGFSISCHVYHHKGIWIRSWDCVCTDILSSVGKTCQKYESPPIACEDALASLVRAMVARKTYPEPCDAASMPVKCGR